MQWIADWNSLIPLLAIMYLRIYCPSDVQTKWTPTLQQKYQSHGYGSRHRFTSIFNHLKLLICHHWRVIIPIASSSRYTSSHGKLFGKTCNSYSSIFISNLVSFCPSCGDAGSLELSITSSPPHFSTTWTMTSVQWIIRSLKRTRFGSRLRCHSYHFQL